MTTGSEPLKCLALSKRYGDIKALEDVSLHIEAGVTAILGENGADKTTLISRTGYARSQRTAEGSLAGYGV
jgi:ABC-type multidrug transport system ATPase subunit